MKANRPRLVIEEIMLQRKRSTGSPYHRRLSAPSVGTPRLMVCAQPHLV